MGIPKIDMIVCCLSDLFLETSWRRGINTNLGYSSQISRVAERLIYTQVHERVPQLRHPIYLRVDHLSQGHRHPSSTQQLPGLAFQEAECVDSLECQRTRHGIPSSNPHLALTEHLGESNANELLYRAHVLRFVRTVTTNVVCGLMTGAHMCHIDGATHYYILSTMLNITSFYFYHHTE